MVDTIPRWQRRLAVRSRRFIRPRPRRSAFRSPARIRQHPRRRNPAHHTRQKFHCRRRARNRAGTRPSTGRTALRRAGTLEQPRGRLPQRRTFPHAGLCRHAARRILGQHRITGQFIAPIHTRCRTNPTKCRLPARLAASGKMSALRFGHPMDWRIDQPLNLPQLPQRNRNERRQGSAACRWHHARCTARSPAAALGHERHAVRQILYRNRRGVPR